MSAFHEIRLPARLAFAADMGTVRGDAACKSNCARSSRNLIELVCTKL